MIKVVIKNKNNSMRTLRFDIVQNPPTKQFYLNNGKISNKKLLFDGPVLAMENFDELKDNDNFLSYINREIKYHYPDFGNWYITKVLTRWFYNGQEEICFKGE